MKIYKILNKDVKAIKRNIKNRTMFFCDTILHHYQLTPRIKRYLADAVAHRVQCEIDILLSKTELK